MVRLTPSVPYNYEGVLMRLNVQHMSAQIQYDRD